MHEFKLAEEYYDKADSTFNSKPGEWYQVYNINLNGKRAIMFNKQKKYNDALAALENALDWYEKLKKANMLKSARFYNMRSIYMLMYQTCVGLQDYPKAEKYILLSDAYIKETGAWEAERIWTHFNLAQLYIKMDSTDKASAYARSTYQLAYPKQDVSKLDIDNISYEQIDFFEAAMGGLSIMGQYYNYAYDKGINTSYLDSSNNFYNRLFALYKEAIVLESDDDAKADMSHMLTGYVDDALKVKQKIYKNRSSNQTEITNEMFGMVQYVKSLVLNNTITNQHQIRYAGLPDSVMTQDESPRLKINELKKKLNDTQANSAEYVKLNEELVNGKKDYANFISQIEKDYPAYYQLKYNNQSITLQQMQDVVDIDMMVVDYYFNDTSLYVFCITHEASQCYIETFSQEDINLLSNFAKKFENPEQLLAESAEEYEQQALSLHQKFVQPFIPKNKEYSHLTIIPSGWLSNISFDCLVDAHSETKSFQNLSYLIRKYAVSYSFSSTYLYLLNQNITTKSQGNRFAGFVPSYQQNVFSEVDTSNDKNLAQLVRSGNVNLPGAMKETELACKIFSGKLFSKEEASEKNFKKYASDYGIIHLSMHGISDYDDPLNSRLDFGSLTSKDSTEDNKLYAAEIYGMHIPARLISLSACNTSTGKIDGNEGVMSLSRAFAYSGCPSVLAGLWQLNDNTTSGIMVGFYKYIKKGQSLDIALQQSKLDYLKTQTDPVLSHPYFWAGSVLIGDTSPIQSNKHYLLWITLGLLILGSAFLILKNLKNN